MNAVPIGSARRTSSEPRLSSVAIVLVAAGVFARARAWRAGAASGATCRRPGSRGPRSAS